jgi:hypothetical protein
VVGVIDRDHHKKDALDRIRELEQRVDDLERQVATLLRIVDAGTGGATEAAWIQVDGGYLRVYASK